MLTCECDFDGDYEFYYEMGGDYSTLTTKRRRRCISCNQLIDVGSVVLKWFRWRYAKDDVEIRIYGDDCEIQMTTQYHCEECADLCFSLEELGFCVMPHDDQRELVKEYADMRRKAA